MAKLKVFAGTVWNDRRQVRAIVACTSQKQAAELLGISVGELRRNWLVTTDPERIAQACERPGQVLVTRSIEGRLYGPQPR